MITAFVLGTIAEDGETYFNLEDIRRDYNEWDEEVINKGFVFDFEDEGGFHYSHPEKIWTVWIRKLFVPA